MKVKTITISGIRGVPSLQLNIDGKNLLIYGENGTGKSSIIDAIEFFFTGTVSHLVGIQAISFEKHCPNAYCSLDEMSVEATVNPGSCKLFRTVSDCPTIPDGLQDEFSILNDGTFILRRSQILSFIASKPSERYKIIAAMLGIQALDIVDSEMAAVIKSLVSERTIYENKIITAFGKIQDELGSTIKKIDDIIKPLNAKLSSVGLPPITSVEEIDIYIQKPEIVGLDTTLSERVSKVRSTFAPLPKELFTGDTLKQLATIEQFVKTHSSQERKGNNAILKLLEAGKISLPRTDVGKCPLCQQEVNLRQLEKDIDIRLTSLKQFTDEAAIIFGFVASQAREVRGAIAEIDKATTVVRSYPALTRYEANLYDFSCLLKDVIEKLDRTEARVELIDCAQLEQQIKEINRVFNDIREFGRAEIEKIAPTESYSNRLQMLMALERIKLTKENIIRLTSEVAIVEKRLLLARKIYDTYSEVRKRNIQELFDAIIVDVAKYYRILHPDDEISDIKLSIVPERRGSAELTVTCFDRDSEDPRAFLSEGHLDSLGLCIFLAFVKRLEPTCPIIALDDVVTTVDSGHRERICGLLYSEFEDSQVIITTHDGVWFEQLLSYQRALNISSVNLEIIDWTPQDGPIIRNKKSSWKTIQEKLSNGDRCGAGNEGRRYLEYVLGELCLLIKANIQFKGSSYKFSTGDLFDGFRGRAKELIIEPEYTGKVLPKIQELDRTRYMGNVLSHNNECASDTSIEEVKSFCNAVNALDELFTCPDCKRRLQYFEKDRVITCSNPKCARPSKINTR